MSTSGHWYDKQGIACHTHFPEKGKNKGKEMPTTLREARKLDLVPSVTTVMNVAANPGLDYWKSNQLLMAALTLPRSKFEPADDFMVRVKKDADQHRDEAARVGTLIHADIERGMRGQRMGEYHEAFTAVVALLNHYFPGIEWVAENSFASPEGYGGAIDLHSTCQSIFVDFKTKDNISALVVDGKVITPGKTGKQLVYGDQKLKYGMQLSAYADGMGCDEPTRMSIFIDRQHPEYACMYLWDQESHITHLRMFKSLLEYWQLSKNYFPGWEH